MHEESLSYNMSRDTTKDKTNKTSVRPAKTQIRLGIDTLLYAQWEAKDPSFHADSKDSDQPGHR